jgi:hypothetical protein
MAIHLVIMLGFIYCFCCELYFERVALPKLPACSYKVVLGKIAFLGVQSSMHTHYVYRGLYGT